MHPEAFSGARRQLLDLYGDFHATPRVLDIGGRNVNGTIHDLLPEATWTVLDSLPGPDVDVVADATQLRFEKQEFDLVVATEVFEHVQNWWGVLHCARSAAPNLVFTCASTGRPPHGAWGDPSPGPGEWYKNVDPQALLAVLLILYPNAAIEYNSNPGDCYGRAWH